MEGHDCCCGCLGQLRHLAVGQRHVLCGYFEEVVGDVFCRCVLVDEQTEHDVGMGVVFVPRFGNIRYADRIPVAGKRDFPRTLTPAISTGRLGVWNRIWSGGGSLCEVEGQQVVDISIARALRQFGKDVAQPR